MTNLTNFKPCTPATEALGIAQRFAVAMAALRGEPIDISHPQDNAFIIARMGLCVTSMTGSEAGDGITRLDGLVATLGIDGLMVRTVVAGPSTHVAFDALLRSGERTDVFPDLRLLIDADGAFWLVPCVPNRQGLMAGHSGLLPVREASEFRGLQREAGLLAGSRYLADKPA